MKQVGFREIRTGLQDRALELAAELLPRGRRNGNYWIARNPTRDDNSAGSFYVWIKGAAAGGWRDDATGDKGDAIDLIAYVGRLSRGEAADWARKWLGWGDGRPEVIATAVRDAGRHARDREAADQAALDANRRKARAMWLGARKWRPGDPVDLYLKGRAIDLAAAGIAASAIRHAPTMNHAESGRSFDCMVAAMSDASGGIVAVHRTWLALLPVAPDAPAALAAMADSDGRAWQKAPIDPVRKIWPEFRGAVIRLAKGASAMSPEEAARKGIKGPVAMGEGVEDGLAVAISRPDLRVWAAGSLGNLKNVPCLPCVSRFVVCQDNDWGKPQAQAQFAAACNALAAAGRPVAVAKSWIGKDVNDLLKGDGDGEKDQE